MTKRPIVDFEIGDECHGEMDLDGNATFLRAGPRVGAYMVRGLAAVLHACALDGRVVRRRGSARYDGGCHERADGDRLAVARRIPSNTPRASCDPIQCPENIYGTMV